MKMSIFIELIIGLLCAGYGILLHVMLPQIKADSINSPVYSQWQLPNLPWPAHWFHDCETRAFGLYGYNQSLITVRMADLGCGVALVRPSPKPYFKFEYEQFFRVGCGGALGLDQQRTIMVISREAMLYALFPSVIALVVTLFVSTCLYSSLLVSTRLSTRIYSNLH